MKTMFGALILAAMSLFGVQGAFAAPLPAGTSDRIFFTELDGTTVIGGEQGFIPESGPNGFALFCSGCTNIEIALVEADGSISDTFSSICGLPDGPKDLCFLLLVSDEDGSIDPLFVPAGALRFPETAEPFEVTDFIGLRQFEQRLFIQSDVEVQVPEPPALMLFAIGMAVLGFSWRRQDISNLNLSDLFACKWLRAPELNPRSPKDLIPQYGNWKSRFQSRLSTFTGAGKGIKRDFQSPSVFASHCDFHRANPHRPRGAVFVEQWRRLRPGSVRSGGSD